MSKPRKSLPRKLSTILILLAAPLFVVLLGSFFSHVQELLHNEAMERSGSILNTTMQRVVNFKTAIETAGKSNAWLLEENFNPDSIQSISHRIVRLNPSLISCSVSTEPDAFPRYGRFFSVYSVNEGDTVLTMVEPEFEYFEKTWYQTALRNGRACWVDPFSDFNEGTINFKDAVGSFCIPLRPNGKKIEGVLSVDFSFNRLAEKVNASELPFPSAFYMMLGNDGRFMIHPETNLLFKKTIFSDVDPVQHSDVIELGREMTAGKTGVTHIIMNGKKYHVSYAPVPETHASLALVCLDDEILADYNHLILIVIIVVVVGLLLIFWITVSLVRRNIKPIDQLLDATQKIAEGNYDEAIPLSDHKDIIAQLQNTFAAMQQSLISKKASIKQTIEEINKENGELEQAMRQAEESAKEKQQFAHSILQKICKPLNIIEGLSNVLLNSLSSRSKNGQTGKQANDPPSQKTPAAEGTQEQEIRNIAATLKHNANQVNRMALMLCDSSKLWVSDDTLYQRNEEVSCNEVARESIDYTRSNYPGSEIRFETELPDDACIKTNHLYLMRSIRELLYNAAKFSDAKHITLRATQTETTVTFTFEDIGPGLTKEWHELFSQPFMKIEEQTEGLGLGLPLTMRHIIGLGGKLTYDTTYHQGCRITMEMPKGILTDHTRTA